VVRVWLLPLIDFASFVPSHSLQLRLEKKQNRDRMPPKKRDDKKNEGEDDVKGEIGVYHFSDGSKYDGQYSKRTTSDPVNPVIIKRHGFGVYVDNGTVYDGQWQDDAMHGEGSITFDTGASYTGSFLNNQFIGSGVYRWPNGSSYEGYWRSNQMHGEGTYVDASGRRWTGKFYNNAGVDLIQEVS
jgi:hypothetical protein